MSALRSVLSTPQKYCAEGKDRNGSGWGQKDFTREELDAQWEFVAKMTLVIRDIMLGNDKLNEIGRHEEALGRNGIFGGFQGQRMWTDYKPNGDFTEAILNSTFDWNGKKQPVILATESDNCNGLAMLFENLLTGRASMFRMPVSLHNIEGKDIYRPHAWSAFGTKDLESADYRACAEYGELYK